ncbi:MAG TPA: hypothetical protein VGB85_01725 [Nannocystis sp.]
MKQVVAGVLRGRSVWQLVAIAAVCTSLALYIIYSSYSSTLRQLKPVLIVLFGIAATALILAVLRCSEDIERHGGAGKRWRRLVLAVFGLAAAISFVTYSFGHYETDMHAACNGSLLPDTLPARRAELAEAEQRLRSPFALLPLLLDDEAERECARSRADLARVEQGLCTNWPMLDVSCACGEERFPYTRCKEPRCLYTAGKPDRFYCVADPIPEGYDNF